MSNNLRQDQVPHALQSHTKNNSVNSINSQKVVTRHWLLRTTSPMGGGQPMKQIFDTRLWKSLLIHMRRWYLMAG